MFMCFLASNQNTSTNYMDLGLAKSNNNGKNSPLSSISSSSMCSIKSNKTKSQSNQRLIGEECFEDEIDQAENTSSASSTASFPGFPLNKTNTPPPMPNNPSSNMAAIIAAFQTSGMNPNMSDLSNLMTGNSGQHGMMSLLNNHASAMSKIKSNLLENLLARKLPNKFPGSQQADMSQMAAAVVAASLNSASSSSNEISAESKSTNLSKLLQNIVEINQLHHFNGNNNNGTNHSASLASSSPSSSSSSSSSENDKQLFNTSFKSELCNNQEESHELNVAHRLQTSDGACTIPDCNCSGSLKVDENSDSEIADDVSHKKRRFQHLNRDRDQVMDQDYSDAKQSNFFISNY